MTQDELTDEEVVQTASDAAEGLIFSRYKQSNVRDCDVTVNFEDGILEVDVYLNVPDDVAGRTPSRSQTTRRLLPSRRSTNCSKSSSTGS